MKNISVPVSTYMRTTRKGPEWYLRRDVRALLEARQWLVEIMHGNAYQKGIPDLYAWHPQHLQRWIDIKVPARYRLTRAQAEKWPLWESRGLGVWILTGASDSEYDKLFAAPNWRDFAPRRDRFTPEMAIAQLSSDRELS